VVDFFEPDVTPPLSKEYVPGRDLRPEFHAYDFERKNQLRRERDLLEGIPVIICDSPLKGHHGTIKSSTATSVYVELLANMKRQSFPMNCVKFWYAYFFFSALSTSINIQSSPLPMRGDSVPIPGSRISLGIPSSVSPMGTTPAPRIEVPSTPMPEALSSTPAWDPSSRTPERQIFAERSKVYIFLSDRAIIHCFPVPPQHWTQNPKLHGKSLRINISRMSVWPPDGILWGPSRSGKDGEVRVMLTGRNARLQDIQARLITPVRPALGENAAIIAGDETGAEVIVKTVDGEDWLALSASDSSYHHLVRPEDLCRVKK
jgi:hypothetical protein